MTPDKVSINTLLHAALPKRQFARIPEHPSDITLRKPKASEPPRSIRVATNMVTKTALLHTSARSFAPQKPSEPGPSWIRETQSRRSRLESSETLSRQSRELIRAPR